jgi:hypothetical protein
VARPVRLLRTGIIVLLPLGLLAAIVCVWPLAAAAGFFGERTYLLVTQDPAELQPSGGYVGAYGAVVLRFARVVSLTFGDSKDLDDGANRQLDAASDSPDFPTAARAMLDVYGELTDTWPDGVIAIDPIAAGGLIDLVGPLRVEGEPQLVTRENLLGLVLKHTQNFDDPQVNRKQFVFDLGRELAARLRALPPTRWPEVVQALVRAAPSAVLRGLGAAAVGPQP